MHLLCHPLEMPIRELVYSHSQDSVLFLSQELTIEPQEQHRYAVGRL